MFCSSLCSKQHKQPVFTGKWLAIRPDKIELSNKNQPVN
jgi:hypothetical protein